MVTERADTFHRVTSLLLWIVLAVLVGSAIYTAYIAIVNWKHIGV